MRRRRNQKPTTSTEYSAGSFIETEKGYFYVVNASKRYRIVSIRVLNSWAPPRVIQTTEAAVSKYRISAKMKFRNGSLIYNLADGKIYLIVEGKRCPIVSPDALSRIGSSINDKGIVTVSKQESELHELGEEIG